MRKLLLLSVLLGLSWEATAQIQIDTLKVYFENIENPIAFIKKDSIGGKLDFYATLLKEKKENLFLQYGRLQ